MVLWCPVKTLLLYCRRIVLCGTAFVGMLTSPGSFTFEFCVRLILLKVSMSPSVPLGCILSGVGFV